MASKDLKSWAKKLLSFLLILSIVTPPLYTAKFAPKAEAFWGIADTTVDVPAWVDRIIDGVSMAIAQSMIDHLVASTVKWAQTGFEGNPAYVTDPKQFFVNVADGAAINFLRTATSGALSLSQGVTDKIHQGLDLLCSPFQANIRLSLSQQYYEPEPFECTISEISGNIEGFYNEFSQGGWETWISMTQTPTNNPYGAYIGAKIEMDARLAEAVGLEKNQLDWSNGYKGWAECLQEDPDTGECLERGPTKTPGSMIKSKLDQVMGSGLEKLITAEHIDQLISGVASGLLNKYVFGDKGLFATRRRATASTNTPNAQTATGRIPQIDVDGDGIPEGSDGDRDGALLSRNDTCFHGGRATSDSSCINSTDPRAANSPYFTPICEAIDETVAALTDFTKYIDTHADHIEGGASLAGQIIGGVLLGGVGVVFGRLFGGGSADNFKNKADAELWGNRISTVDSGLDEIVNAIQSRQSPHFDNMEIATNRFANYIGRVYESLIKDSDLDLKGIGSSGGGGLANLMKHSAYNLRYLQEAKTKMVRCDAPNVQALATIPLPPTVEEADPADSDPGGGECSAPLPVPGGTPPNMFGVVAQVAADFPELLASSGQNMDFLDKVIETLRASDTNWGYNGKRGNASDLSQDAIAYLAGAPNEVHIFDIIGGHGGSNPQPAWQDVTAVTYECGVTGLYVYPR